MIGVCKRLSLAIVLLLMLLGPAYATLSNGAYRYPDPTGNSVTTCTVDWSDGNNQLPDTEPWFTYHLGINRLKAASRWQMNPNYYTLQPDPADTVSEDTTAVDLKEMVYCELQGGNIVLPEAAVAIKGVWADRWARVNLLTEQGCANFPGGDTISPQYYNKGGVANNHVFVSYYIDGTTMAVVKGRPLPSAMTVYKIPVERDWDRVYVNPSIFKLDADTYGARTGGDPTNNVLGVFDNEACKRPDYLDSANITTGKITLNNTVPAYTRYMYVAVSSFAVDAVIYGGQVHQVEDYDPDTGEITLPTTTDESGDPVKVVYRPLGRDRLTLGMAPVTDINWIRDPAGQAHLGRKQFDGATGKVVLDPPVDWNTRYLTAKYTCVDINNVTPDDTWTFLEGGRIHPIVRESDDQEQRYCTLQPDPVDVGNHATSGSPGLYHGVRRNFGEGGFFEVTMDDLAGVGVDFTQDAQTLWQEIFFVLKMNAPCWMRMADADEAKGYPAVPFDIIVPTGNAVWIKELIVNTPEGPVDYGSHCDVFQDPLGNWSILVDPENPIDAESTLASVSYWVPGKLEVLVPGPSPMPCTVSVYDLDGFAQPHTDMLRVNTNLLYQDPDTEKWRGEAVGGADNGFNVLGVYDNIALQGWNYFTPGRGAVTLDMSGAAVLNLNMTPAIDVGKLYMKTSTYAIDGVWRCNPATGGFDPTFDAFNYYPGAMPKAVYEDPENAAYGFRTEFYDPSIKTDKPYTMAESEEDTTMYVTEIHLATPLQDDGEAVAVTHRALSRTSMTPPRGPVMAVPLLEVIDPKTGKPVAIQDKLVDEPPVWSAALNPEDETALYPLGTQMLYDIAYHAGMCISGNFTDAVYTNGLGRFGPPVDCQPMYAGPEHPGQYWLSVTAGLNMANQRQQPRYDTFDFTDICLLRDYNVNPIDYAPMLTCNPDRSPAARTWGYVAATHPATLGKAPQVDTAGPVTATVHQSSPSKFSATCPDYGAGSMLPGLDFLTNYPGASWPVDFPGPDPLVPVSPSAVVPMTINPDNGSSSTTFDFRVMYTNADNLPPRPWLPSWVELYNDNCTASGVVMYFDLMDVFDLGNEFRHDSWRPYFMQPENATDANYAGGVNYLYRMQPCDVVAQSPNPWAPPPVPPTPLNGNAYVSLMIGTYHYFFGCSDDQTDLGMADETYALANQFIGDGNPWGEWGNIPPIFKVPLRSSTGLDPHTPRSVVDEVGRPFMPRGFCRRYSSTGDAAQDYEIYIDRYDRVPGMFEGNWRYQYPWKSIEHPEVTVALSGYGASDTDGFGRFHGTVKPFYRAVNPAISTPWMPGGFGWASSRLETCGATQSTTLTFKIKYQQRDNKAPNYIKVFINGTSLKVIDPSLEMKPENGGYIGYTMVPAAIQTATGQSQKPPYDYRIGVDYEFKTQLPAGPHTYYFMANDGTASVIYPARPEDWFYGPGWTGDLWVPGAPRGNAPAGFDNNYVPGPYINHPCEAASATVNPATGIEGQQFVYRVLYRDPDGQRPFQTRIYIDTGTAAGVIAADMLKEDPNANNYVTGVWYSLNSATLDKFAMANGVRRYRFEFIDDWGRQTDPNDVVKGETTYAPASGGWIDGPTIGSQAKPTLRFGKVLSTDGTSNGATLWKFSVTYTDINNDAPKFVTLYTGKLLADAETIEWDNGRQMTQVDPGDKTYYDGAEFIYQTRLHQSLVDGETNEIYYYAFEASDGVQLATYVPEDYPDVNARSESAGCELKVTLTTDDNELYRSNRVPLVGTLRNQPTSAGILIDPVVWMQIQGHPEREIICSREDTYIVRGMSDQSPTAVNRADDVDAAYLPVITEVEGVYLNPELTGTDYYHAVDSLGRPTSGSYDPGYGLVTLAQPLPFGNKWSWIKYRHTREQLYHCGIVATDEPGVVQRANDVDMNNAPEIHEILSVTAGGTADYYHLEDGTSGSYDPMTRLITLAKPLPSAVDPGDVVVTYRVPTYTLNRWSGEVTFTRPQSSDDIFRADYFFGTRHSSEISQNIPPQIYNPKLTPMVGASGTDYVYTIDYKESEGPNGQAPSYVRVVIDGVEHDMMAKYTGLPQYKAGVTFTYTAKLPSGSHNFYFTASDGAGMVTLPQADPDNGRVQPLLGPWVNDPPRLANGIATPNPSGSAVSTLQPVNYTVVFSDPDNDAPITYYPFASDENASDAIKQLGLATPLLFVDNANEAWNVGTVAEIVEDPAQPGKHRSIRVCDKTGNTAQYTADQFAGKLLQFVSGTLAGRIYLIANNTTDELKLMTDDLIEDGLVEDTPFTIAAFQMFKADASEQNYAAGVTYSLRIPQLSEGQHKFHFKSASTMAPPSWIEAPYNAMTQSQWVRFPSAGEVTGPTAAVQSPDTNHIPILSMAVQDGQGVSPASGKSTDNYDFFVTYRDADGDPPRYHDGMLGYVRLVFNDGTFAGDLRPDVVEDQFDPNFYMTSRRFSIRANGLPEGTHKFHFEGSDGWIKVRWPEAAQGSDPAAGDPQVVVNVKARLSNAAITPPDGDTNTRFDITVKYVDMNNQRPHQSTINGQLVDEVWVEFAGNAANKLYLTRDVTSGTNYQTGVVYKGSKTGLAAGHYTTVFKANDYLGEMTSVAGPTISVSANQTAPTLTEAKVYNTTNMALVNGDATGGNTSTFKYEVKYTDADGDMPFASQNGTVIEGLKLYIDGNFEAIVTQKVATATLENGKPDYTQPVTYTYTRTGSKYTGGDHTYYFEVKDGTSADAHTVRTAEIAGPTMLAATIGLTRKVSDGSGGWVDKDPKLTERVRISGVLSEAASKPIPGGQTFAITVTRPDKTTITTTVTGATQATETVRKNEFYYDLEIPMQNNQWTVVAKWNGNSDYAQQVISTIKIDVKGPTRVMATKDMTKPDSAPVVDMVCMPLASATGDAGSLFGFERARMMQIVKWDPEQRTYLWYGDTYFPAITPGSAVWILPSALYPVEGIDSSNVPSPVDSEFPIEPFKQYRLLKPFGKLFPQQNNCEIQLKQGWNQIGSPFLQPTEISRAQVVYQDKTVSIDQAATNGWIRNYAWMWDPIAQRGDRLIHATRPDAYSKSFEPWRGYWIKSLVDCTLVLTSPNLASAASLKRTVNETCAPASADTQELDLPPSAPLAAAK